MRALINGVYKFSTRLQWPGHNNLRVKMTHRLRNIGNLSKHTEIFMHSLSKVNIFEIIKRS